MWDRTIIVKEFLDLTMMKDSANISEVWLISGKTSK